MARSKYDINGVYNSSYPSGYTLTIISSNNDAGNFKGKFSSPSGDEDISGGYLFDNSARRTDLSFNTRGARWELWAPYNSDGPYLEDFAVKTPTIDPNSKTPMQFFIDLSGDSKGSVFGPVDNIGTKYRN